MCNLGELVDDDKNSVMTLLRLRKTSDEIHLDFIPFPQGNRKRLQKSSRLLMFCLDATTNVTFSNIASNVLLHVRPPVPLTKVLIHLGATRMNRQWGIMCVLHNFVCHKFEPGYHKAISEAQGSIFSKREIFGLFKGKIPFHLINFSVFCLCRFNSFLESWFQNKGIKRTLWNDVKVQLTKFFMKKGLSLLN